MYTKHLYFLSVLLFIEKLSSSLVTPKLPNSPTENYWIKNQFPVPTEWSLKNSWNQSFITRKRTMKTLTHFYCFSSLHLLPISINTLIYVESNFDRLTRLPLSASLNPKGKTICFCFPSCAYHASQLVLIKTFLTYKTKLRPINSTRSIASRRTFLILPEMASDIISNHNW